MGVMSYKISTMHKVLRTKCTFDYYINSCLHYYHDRCSIDTMKKSSIPSLIMTILWEVGNATVEAFFNPRYARKYGYSHLYNNRFLTKPYHAKSYNLAIKRLENRGYIKRENNIYYLTDNGQKEAFLNYIKDNGSPFIDINKPDKWDRKWRIIFFDVPEKKRILRDELRIMLKAIGFKEFQKSIWIYPYPVPDYLKKILFEEKIKQYTRLITTENIEYDRDLRSMFNLR